MPIYEAGVRFRQGYENTPSAYLKWGIVEGVYEEDVKMPAYDSMGELAEGYIPVTWARSLVVRWIDSLGGRSSVKFIEPWGVTSIPAVGAIVCCGFTGSGGGEPVALGFWTQGYPERQPSEFGHLKPGQEVVRRSGYRLRIVPMYTNLRQFSEQHQSSPWEIDVILGEQHDEAAWCSLCQTRFAMNADGSLPERCPTIGELDPNTGERQRCTGKPRLVVGSVASSELDSELGNVSNIIINSVLVRITDGINKAMPIVTESDSDLISWCRTVFTRWLYASIGPTYKVKMSDYFKSWGQSYIEGMISEYIQAGMLHNFHNDAPNYLGTQIVNALARDVNSWIGTNMYSIMVNKSYNSEVASATTLRLKNEVASLFEKDIPNFIKDRVAAWIITKGLAIISDRIAMLRRRAISALHKLVLANIKKKISGIMKDKIGIDFNFDVKGWLARKGGAAYDALANLTMADFINDVHEVLSSEGVADPEELPIYEFRLKQDSRSVINPNIGREVGQGTKSTKFRVQLYRDGAAKISVGDKLTVKLDPEGDVSIEGGDTLIFSMASLLANFDAQSQINVPESMLIGDLEKETDKVALDEDLVREYDSVGAGGLLNKIASRLGIPTGGALGGLSTRQFIEQVAQAAVMRTLYPMFTAAAATMAAGMITAPVAPAFTELATAAQVLGNIPGPPSNSVVGKVDATAEHLKSN